MTARDFRERLGRRALKAQVALPPAVVDQLETYYRLLARWNDRINLTALPLRELTDQAIDRLLIEPLAAAQYIQDSPIAWFDLGSGGGSPALPLKIVRPAVRLTMVESKTRKAAFLREAVRALGLAETIVVSARFGVRRASDPGQYSADLVTVRGVKLAAALLAAVQALLKPDGRLFLFQSRGQDLVIVPGYRVVRTAKLAGAPHSQLVILARS